MIRNLILTLKRLCFFYVINLVVLLYELYLYGYLLTGFTNLAVWLLPLLFAGLGQMIGFLSYLFVEDTQKKNRVFLTGAIIGSVVFCVASTFITYTEWDHELHYGNIESNAFYLKYVDEGFAQPVKQAFAAIEGRLKDKNSIRLLGHKTTSADTTLDGYAETCYTVCFFYTKKYKPGMFKSYVKVLRNDCYLLKEDALTRREIEKVIKRYDEVQENVENALKTLPDTTAQRIRQEMGGLF